MASVPLPYVYQVVAVNSHGAVHMQPVFAERRQAQRNAAALAETHPKDVFTVIALAVEWPKRGLN